MMVNVQAEAMARKSQADMVLERTALQLRGMLEEAARQLRPFPPFPGAFFTNAIEVEAAGDEALNRGCIVVCEDGELYELEMSVNFSDEVTDPVQARDEKLTKLEEIHPRDYIMLAYEALNRITEQLMEQAEQGRGR